MLKDVVALHFCMFRGDSGIPQKEQMYTTTIHSKV